MWQLSIASAVSTTIEPAAILEKLRMIRFTFLSLLLPLEKRDCKGPVAGRLKTDSGLLLVLSLLAWSPALLANPYVSGNEIRWDLPGWFQVQSADNYATVCEGGNACAVEAGNYNVINLTTGERWENLTVRSGAAMDGPVNIGRNVFLDNRRISWTDNDWYQVQDRADFSTVCEGGSFCDVEPGRYIVINHTTGYRLNNVRVAGTTTNSGGGGSAPSGPDPVTPSQTYTITGSNLVFNVAGWFQVQRASDFQTVCEGQQQCTLQDGTYTIINHSTAERIEGVVVGSAQPPVNGGDSGDQQGPGNGQLPEISGNTIVLNGVDWYQIQSSSDFRTVCEGSISSCDVADGVYSVINHSNGTRIDNVRVGLPLVYVGNPADPFNKSLENVTASAPADGRPSTPQHLRIELVSNEWVEFNWARSADDDEVVAYNIYRDDPNTPLYVLSRDTSHPNGGVASELAKYWNTTSFIDCNKTRFYNQVFFCVSGPNGEPGRAPIPGSRHTYYVSAVDNLGNESDLSEPLVVQLYEYSGSPVSDYQDPDLAPSTRFPRDSNVSQPSAFLGEFELIFEDDFNGSALDTSKWNSRLTWGPDVTINGEKQYFVDTLNTPDFGYQPFSFTGSTLKITAEKTPPELLAAANDKRYLSGALSSFDKFGFTYGYVESRMKVSGVFGTLSTIYLYHRYPGDHGPEIDIAEYLGYNQFGDEDMFQTYHYRDVNYDQNGLTRSTPTMSHRNESGALYADAFHTYGVLWQPGLVIWYIDGVEVKRLHGPQVGRREMNLVTYLVTGSRWTDAPDEYSPADELVEANSDAIVNLPFKLEADYPIELEIDYIRVWQLPDHIQ